MTTGEDQAPFIQVINIKKDTICHAFETKNKVIPSVPWETPIKNLSDRAAPPPAEEA